MKDRLIKKLEDQIKTLTKTIGKCKIWLHFFFLTALNDQYVNFKSVRVWGGVRNENIRKMCKGETPTEIT